MPATAAGTPRPNPVRRLAAWLTAKHNSSLVFLLALSLGLGLVAPQVGQLWLLIVFSVVWGVTIVAFVTQFAGRHEHAHPHHA
ncbi:hypothetical protein OU787_01615 [Kitasatospora sp. YST-16]|uniref:hypothetical protein n=1 Tax=Kitasatospora sp. YST-16 TaxID=2998080 RepID=UPI002283DE94|nr:hypothetical protein [Kitasatospora sp. YST-16]WAL70300.1 hypothetical protein OU787_01615 [Kitasatospora sp. YST-16]WNW36342.1 hypothetical protein RKE32_01630 [Streptomyces sp. Li-HN-5-13]